MRKAVIVMSTGDVESPCTSLSTACVFPSYLLYPRSLRTILTTWSKLSRYSCDLAYVGTFVFLNAVKDQRSRVPRAQSLGSQAECSVMVYLGCPSSALFPPSHKCNTSGNACVCSSKGFSLMSKAISGRRLADRKAGPHARSLTTGLPANELASADIQVVSFEDDDKSEARIVWQT